MIEPAESLPLPDDPVLAAWASALNETGHWANLLDAEWRFVFQTDELLKTLADMGGVSTARSQLGLHFFSEEVNQRNARVLGGAVTSREFRRPYFAELGPYVLASTPGGRDELRRVVDPELADLVDELQPQPAPPTWIVRPEWTTAGVDATGSAVWFRIDDGRGRVVGFCVLSKPAAGMSHLGAAAATADLAHLERMRAVERPDRRPTAILMADLESSTPLARRLSTRGTSHSVGVSSAPRIDASSTRAASSVGTPVMASSRFFSPTRPDPNRPQRDRVLRPPERCATVSPRLPRAARYQHPRSHCASGCTGARRSIWGGSSLAAAAKSPRWATK